ncbi:MAG: type II toxin-antitoxin system RelE/ParE family toxin [Flavobacteriaceae bacterium]|nr:type II toxin-antitoxin system RelE/ParE family toxin [Flavobacteriaceae bacterium]
MDISFCDNKLRKYANDDLQAIRKLGLRRAKIYKQRLDELSAVETLEDIRYLPGKFHELTGDRKGQWACSLDYPYRLIFEPHQSPIPTDDNGRYIWIEIKGIEIIEIVDYH